MRLAYVSHASTNNCENHFEKQKLFCVSEIQAAENIHLRNQTSEKDDVINERSQNSSNRPNNKFYDKPAIEINNLYAQQSTKGNAFFLSNQKHPDFENGLLLM